MSKKNKKKIYLDYAATTPVNAEVISAMEAFLGEKFGNPASLHQFGQEAKEALEKSRGKVANLISAKTEEIIFTSSATESNNLALKGLAQANKEKGSHIIISSVEHDCVREAANWLKEQGFEITQLPVDRQGFVDLQDLKDSLKKETILVSIIHASNEIGTIQSLEKIGALIEEESEALFHSDAAQSFGKIPLDVNKSKLGLLTFSSHKIYGPKGVGGLYIREGLEIEPLLHGGGQERGLRSSTVNVAGIVGFAKAADIAQEKMEEDAKKQTALRDKLIKGILKIPGAHLNGHPKERLPNNANFWFEGVEGEAVVIKLDLEGVAVSTGSACSSAKLEASPILLAIGLTPKQAHGSLRLSLGRDTTEDDINYVLEILPSIIKDLRKISGRT